ncbi:hydantoinase B/oxoprolinase family protein [Enterovirga rhinocerotis]|uniref:N-methylhydantoinase B n=1 Tax=Enterovirga rhinocerotis TaxID=1339210 RepID=A0A4R7C3F1_9HYPH|nr:hydantoinase B/oxoprolinase family protein [Enterovirga rhinocerotis]TDR92938.1 N-methylhydantoinase B [Enterovirga rhinocerotis]
MNAQTKVSRRVEPVTLTVVWNSLVSIADEMGGALRRTAFSEAVREGEDFSTGLFDKDGRLIAQGNFTPGHLGAMPYAVANVLKYIPPDQLEPGDTLCTNDSFLGGSHFPDFFLVTPVFEGEEIIGYVVNTAHHVDVGGAYPGSEAVQGVTEAFAEGLRVLPVKLIHKGEFDQDILRIILGNVRLPDKVRGDLFAQRNANHVGAERFRKLVRAYGRDAFENIIEEILDRSEARTRELLAALPQGTFSFEDQIDDYGPNTPPIRVAVDVTLDEAGVTVDLSRSSDQVAAGLNCYINYTRAYGSFAMRIFGKIDVPNNAGVERVIKVVAREGSFFNAVYPAPSGGRASVQVRIFDTINGAMAKCVPERVMGAFTHWGNPKIGGVDDSGKRWIMYDLIFGGFGGRSDKDGVEGLAPVMNCNNVPIEVHETNNPVRIHQVAAIADSCGAGEFRGGCGVRKDVELMCDTATVVLLGDRHKSQPYGVFGGGAGALARTVLVRDGEDIDLGSKEVRQLRRGDLISFRLAGAGGYGDPRKRSAEKIKRDVADGYVSREKAVELYGADPASLTS